jgi:hypothetical protein
MSAPSPLSQQGALFAKIGVAMQAAVPLGVLCTAMGIMKEFDPAGGVQLWTVSGIFVAFLGHILMAVSVGISRYRARWFFWAIVISAPLLIPSFPLGTFVFVYALVKREEFLKPAPAAV